MGALGFGEPSWQMNTDGGWDVVPLVMAAAALLILKVVFRVTLRWYVVVAAVLLAPLYRAFADRIGMPVAVGLGLIVATAVVTGARRSRRTDPSPDV